MNKVSTCSIPTEGARECSATTVAPTYYEVGVVAIEDVPESGSLTINYSYEMSELFDASAIDIIAVNNLQSWFDSFEAPSVIGQDIQVYGEAGENTFTASGNANSEGEVPSFGVVVQKNASPRGQRDITEAPVTVRATYAPAA